MNEDCDSAPVERNVMPRYGIQWNGPKDPIATEMVDGYWTPWHLANDTIMKLRIEVEELFGEYWDCAYQEGHLNRPDGDKANEILHRLRNLFA
jgi:hypothetical protein